MEKEELEQQRRISEIKQALVKLGFEDDGRYFRKSGSSIKVFDDDNLEDILKRLIAFSETQKLWEIQRALGINF